MDQYRNLELVQHNITSIRPLETRKILQHFLNTNNIDIAILQEIWMKPNEDFKFNGYNFTKSVRINGYGGVGIITKKEIRYEEVKLPKLEPIEAVAIKTLNTLTEMIIISIYIPPLPVSNNDIKEPLKKYWILLITGISPLFLQEISMHTV